MAITYKGLLVGNSEFPDDPHNLLSLKGPLNDVRLLKKALCDPEMGLYSEHNVNTLENASARKIMIELEAFFSNASRDDQLLFYYSGHGYTNIMNQLFLCARDTVTNTLVSTAISDSNINAMIQNSASRKIVIILDCCNSGNFKGGELPQNLKGSGRFILTSSQSGQLSNDTKNESSPSPFTKYLLEALLNDEVDVNQDGYVGINEVYEFIFPKLNAETKQIPHRHFDKTIGDLPMGKSKKTPKQSKAADEQSGSNTIILGSGKAKLGLSENRIEHRYIQPDEELPDEIIDVFNEGAGELNWTAETNCDWIELETSGTFIKIKLKPKDGINRGTIRVSDENGGGSKTIRLFVEKLAESSNLNSNNEEPGSSEQRVLLKTFNNVTIRFPENAKAVVDNEEQLGRLKVFSDHLRFFGKDNFKIFNIEQIAYLPQLNYPGNTQNYMAVTGLHETVVRTFYFYIFSWWKQNSTLIMTDDILELVKNRKLKVAEGFKQDQPDPTPPPKSPNSPSTNQTPPASQRFQIYMPGQWNMFIYQFGQQIAALQLNLAQNGNLSGTQQTSAGITQITGKWGFNEYTKILQYNVVVYSYGQTIPDHGSVQLSVAGDGSISGIDNQSRNWVLQRIG